MIPFLRENSAVVKRVILSQPQSSLAIKKISYQAVEIQKKPHLQKSYVLKNQAYHQNFSIEQAIDEIEKFFLDEYAQVLIETDTTQAHLIKKAGKIKLIKTAKESSIPILHNREKNHFLSEKNFPKFFVDLGIFTQEGKVQAKMQSKFRQINHFIDLIQPVIDELKQKQDSIAVIDIGCGKGYLTFALYDFLKKSGFKTIQFIGLDLKEDVIKTNTHIKEKYQLEGLEFIDCNANAFQPNFLVDVVIALHACDVATDFAIKQAISWKSKAIFLAPCCQQKHLKEIHHEDLEPIFQYGIFKERMNAIITDGIRAAYLKKMGYQVKVAEFVDREDSLKNILIKAVFTGVCKDVYQKNYNDLKEKFNIKTIFD